MQRDQHETEILNRLQPGLAHKKSLFEQKTGTKKPMIQNE